MWARREGKVRRLSHACSGWFGRKEIEDPSYGSGILSLSEELPYLYPIHLLSLHPPVGPWFLIEFIGSGSVVLLCGFFLFIYMHPPYAYYVLGLCALPFLFFFLRNF